MSSGTEPVGTTNSSGDSSSGLSRCMFEADSTYDEDRLVDSGGGGDERVDGGGTAGAPRRAAAARRLAEPQELLAGAAEAAEAGHAALARRLQSVAPPAEGASVPTQN